MYPMMLALLALDGALTAPMPGMGHHLFDPRPPLPKYRPDLSLDLNRETRRRPSYRMRGIGITRSQRNPRR